MEIINSVDNTIVTGSSAADTIINSYPNVTIKAGDGDDKISNI